MIITMHKQRRRRTTKFLQRSLKVAITSSTLLLATLLITTLPLLPLASAIDPDCQHPHNASPQLHMPYTGFSLKTSTACSQYVYCQNGIVTSSHKCPVGLIYTGAVGVGGICDWKGSVECADGSLRGAFGAAVSHGQGAVVEFDNRPSGLTGGGGGGSGTSGGGSDINSSNPRNYFCGSSRAEAARICIPCTSGSMAECMTIDKRHSCFEGVSACGVLAVVR